MKKEKTIKLTQGHRATIRDTFNAEVDKRQATIKTDTMTPLVHEVLRKMFTSEQLEAYNAAPLALCGPGAGDPSERVYVYVRVMPDGKGFSSANYLLAYDPKFRVPSQLDIPRKLFDRLWLVYKGLEDDSNRIKQACNTVVAACRTVADLKAQWPDGRAFWGELVQRLEDESGTSVSCSLIPVSQIKALNDYCAKCLTGAKQ